MRILLDTNIFIHREAGRVMNKDIGVLFLWLDKLHYTKCIHPISVEEVKRHKDPKVVATMEVKVGSYHVLKTLAAISPDVAAVGTAIDKDENDKSDTIILNEVFNDRVDILLTEDKKIHVKAKALGISDKVFRIDAFLEKMLASNPELVDYKVLLVRKVHFGNVDLQDAFFESFREDYTGFNFWFNKKADEEAYVCYQADVLSAFLFVKVEDEAENYTDITPAFGKKKRLKIGTFKVVFNGIKLGERFLKIVFDNARKQKVQEIYVTIFDNRPDQKRLIELLLEWGFVHHGVKQSISGEENVYVRNFQHDFNEANPKLTFPYLSNKGIPKVNRVFIVPINPEYHTKLLPDSILKTEKNLPFEDTEPYRHAISKSYVSHSRERNLKPGDLIVFYRKGPEGSQKKYTSVATSVGIVEQVIDGLKTFEDLQEACRKRTVLTDDELKEYWDRYHWTRPFVVNFLYAFPFLRRPTLKELVEDFGLIGGYDAVPRGFEEISWDGFANLVERVRL